RDHDRRRSSGPRSPAPRRRPACAPWCRRPWRRDTPAAATGAATGAVGWRDGETTAWRDSGKAVSEWMPQRPIASHRCAIPAANVTCDLGRAWLRTADCIHPPVRLATFAVTGVQHAFPHRSPGRAPGHGAAMAVLAGDRVAVDAAG